MAFPIIRTWKLARLGLALAAGLTVVVALTAACGAGSPHGELADNQQLLAQCEPSAPPASFVQIELADSNVTVTKVSRETAPGTVARALFASLISHRPRSRVAGA